MDDYWNQLRGEALRTALTDFQGLHPAHLFAEKLPPDVKTDFKTQLAFGGGAGSAQAQGQPRLIGIGKRPGGLYPDRISLGRTRKSDIIVVHAKVSKYHGYFEKVDGEYRFTDYDSTNGTFVNGRRLSPRAPKPLVDRDTIKFGDVEFQFLLPETVYALLRTSRSVDHGE